MAIRNNISSKLSKTIKLQFLLKWVNESITLRVYANVSNKFKIWFNFEGLKLNNILTSLELWSITNTSIISVNKFSTSKTITSVRIKYEDMILKMFA
jgi:hypothetical protein